MEKFLFNTCFVNQKNHHGDLDRNILRRNFIRFTFHCTLAIFLKILFVSDEEFEIDISERLMQAKLHNLVARIKTCSDNEVVFNQDVSDLMNRLVSGDVMANTEIQVIEANLDIVTDYNGKLLSAMTTPITPKPEDDKVKNILFPSNFFSEVVSHVCVLARNSSRNLGNLRA